MSCISGNICVRMNNCIPQNGYFSLAFCKIIAYSANPRPYRPSVLLVKDENEASAADMVIAIVLLFHVKLKIYHQLQQTSKIIQYRYCKHRLTHLFYYTIFIARQEHES